MKIYFLLNLLVSSVYSMNKNENQKIPLFQLIINNTRENTFDNPDKQKLKLEQELINNGFLEANCFSEEDRIAKIKYLSNKIYYNINEESPIRKNLEKIMRIESNQNKPLKKNTN